VNTRASYEDLRGRLRWLLIRNEDQLPKTTAKFISEFIDANECGLALETLSEMLVESKARVDRQTVDAVALLALDMGLDALNAHRLHPLLDPAD
jgi:hypothetical protein